MDGPVLEQLMQLVKSDNKQAMKNVLNGDEHLLLVCFDGKVDEQLIDKLAGRDVGLDEAVYVLHCDAEEEGVGHLLGAGERVQDLGEDVGLVKDNCRGEAEAQGGGRRGDLAGTAADLETRGSHVLLVTRVGGHNSLEHFLKNIL